MTKPIRDVARDMDKVPIKVGDLVCASWDYPKRNDVQNLPLYLVIDVTPSNHDVNSKYRYFKLICFPRSRRSDLREFFANEVYFVQSL